MRLVRFMTCSSLWRISSRAFAGQMTGGAGEGLSPSARANGVVGGGQMTAACPSRAVPVAGWPPSPFGALGSGFAPPSHPPGAIWRSWLQPNCRTMG